MRFPFTSGALDVTKHRLPFLPSTLFFFPHPSALIPHPSVAGHLSPVTGFVGVDKRAPLRRNSRRYRRQIG